MKLKTPADIKTLLNKRYTSQHKAWLRGEGTWPLEIPLGIPTEKEVASSLSAVQQWVRTWQRWEGKGLVVWTERHWSMLGTQRLPERLILNNADEVVSWIGVQKPWSLASQRFEMLIAKWPSLSYAASKSFDVLALYSEENFERLINTLQWLYSHPNSGLYPRQLPISGIDTKWLNHRKNLVTEWLTVLQNKEGIKQDFYTLCGLKAPPLKLCRIRPLDTSLRQSLGGLSDIQTTPEDIAQLSIPVQKAIIVENLETGLALPDIPHTIAFMGLGYHVDVLAKIPWLNDIRCFYWGDLDTHGFSILHQARQILPHLCSLLMDEETLLKHKRLWVTEHEQHTALSFDELTQEESKVYEGIKNNRWGENIRLEQERIHWEYAKEILNKIVGEYIYR